MSARADAAPMRFGIGIAAFLVITALMLTLFAWINRSIFDRPRPPRPSPAVAAWDAGKLEAMQGRVLAEAHRRELAGTEASAAVRAPAVGFERWTMGELLEARALAEGQRRELAETRLSPGASARARTEPRLARELGGRR